jgi:hypothetical protein
VVPPWQGVSSIDRHDYVFLTERSRITPARVFVKLRTPGEGPLGHEAPRHAIVLELMHDEVCVVWAGFLEETLEVVRRWSRLMLVTMRGG